MDQAFLNDPALAGRRLVKPAGHVFFREGDLSEDLYMLLRGSLEVLKGDQKISGIAAAAQGEDPVFFGEMAIILGQRRTATVRAATEVEVLWVPAAELESFLVRHPEITRAVAKLLARRLSETSQVLVGFKELADQLPEAVLITDAQGLLRNYNGPARRLYGRDWHLTAGESLAQAHDRPEEFVRALGEAMNQGTIKERVLAFHHPQKGRRMVSLSFSKLSGGGERLPSGVLVVARDVTRQHRSQRLWKRALLALAPLLLVAGLGLGVAWHLAPRWVTGTQVVTAQQQRLAAQISKDLGQLSNWLRPFLARGGGPGAESLLESFMLGLEPGDPPYTGVMLLDSDKRVLAAFSPEDSQGLGHLVGQPYGRMELTIPKNGSFTVHQVHRSRTPGGPSFAFLELAHPLAADGETTGWLVLQLDPGPLQEGYDLDAEGLRQLKLPSTRPR